MGTSKLSFLVASDDVTALSAKTLIVPVFQQATSKADGDDKDDKEDKKSKLLVEGAFASVLPLAGGDDLLKAFDAEVFNAGSGKVWLWRKPAGSSLNAERIVFVGLGQKAKLSVAGLFRNLATGVSAALKLQESLRELAILVPEAYSHNGGSLFNEEANPIEVTNEAIGLAVVDAVAEATYKSLESKKKPLELPAITLATANKAVLESVLPLAQALAAGRSLTKDLVNMPANIKTTQTMVDAAQALKADYPHLELTIQSDVAWIAKEMPCFFAVAQGSVTVDPPKFIHLVYKGANAKRKIALVGKSVIFDTGGYQVKPGNSMVTMKGDMAGGASVLGVLRVIAEMQPEDLELHVYLAATPNRIDANAYVPDSILDTTCGKKVEMRHTDAEGRLTLIDAVTKAELESPELIVTVATLTGAAMRAVGRTVALMGNHSGYKQALLAAAQVCGEPYQALEITPSDYEDIQSKLDGADLRNTSKNENRGAQSAAAFVLSGAKETQPMLHLDIAGADMMSDETATALSVRSLAHFVLKG